MSFHRFLLVSASLLVFACGSGPASEEDSDEGALEQGIDTPSASANDAGADADADADAGADADADAKDAIRPGEYGGVESDNALYSVSVYQAGNAILSGITANGNLVTIAEGLPSEILLGPEGDTCPGYTLTRLNDTTIEVGLADGTARAGCVIDALGKYVAGQ